MKLTGKKRMKKLFGVVFFIGLLLLGLTSYLAYHSHSFTQQAEKTVGVVTNLRFSRSDDSSSGSWYPEFTFKDQNGRQFVVESSVGSSSFRNSLGKPITILYDRNNPDNAQIDSVIGLYLGSIIAGIFAVALLVIGGIGLTTLSLKGRDNTHLLQEGEAISTLITGVAINRSIEINGCSPCQIISQWHDKPTNTVHQFKSPNLYYDPTPYIKEGDEITVYVAPGNMKQYLVDISHLPKQA